MLTVEDFATCLRGNGWAVTRQEIVDLFRHLEEMGLGKFYRGRRGKPSRIEWNGPAVPLVIGHCLLRSSADTASSNDLS